MLAERNKVKLPGDCVNRLCQVLHSGPLKIIDIETPLAKCKVPLTSRTSPERRDVAEPEIYSYAPKLNSISVGMKLEKEDRQGEWNDPGRDSILCTEDRAS